MENLSILPFGLTSFFSESPNKQERSYRLSPDQAQKKNRMLDSVKISLEPKQSGRFFQTLEKFGIKPETFQLLKFTKDEVKELLEDLKKFLAGSRELRGGAVEELLIGKKKADIDITYYVREGCLDDILAFMEGWVLKKITQTYPKILEGVPEDVRSATMREIYLYKRSTFFDKGIPYSTLYVLGNLDLKVIDDPDKEPYDISVGGLGVNIDDDTITFASAKDADPEIQRVELDQALQDLAEGKARVPFPDRVNNLFVRLLHRSAKEYEVSPDLFDMAFHRFFRNGYEKNYITTCFTRFIDNHYALIERDGALRALFFLLQLIDVLDDKEKLEEHQKLIQTVAEQIEMEPGSDRILFTVRNILASGDRLSTFYPILKGALLFYLVGKDHSFDAFFSRKQKMLKFRGLYLSVGLNLKGSIIAHFERAVRCWSSAELTKEEKELVKEIFSSSEMSKAIEAMVFCCDRQLVPPHFVSLEDVTYQRIQFYSRMIPFLQGQPTNYAQGALEKILRDKLHTRRSKMTREDRVLYNDYLNYKEYLLYIVKKFVLANGNQLSNEFRQTIIDSCEEINPTEMIDLFKGKESSENRFWLISLHIARIKQNGRKSAQSLLALPALYNRLSPKEKAEIEPTFVDIFKSQKILKRFPQEFMNEFYRCFCALPLRHQKAVIGVLTKNLQDNDGFPILQEKELQTLIEIIPKFQSDIDYVLHLIDLHIALLPLQQRVQDRGATVNMILQLYGRWPKMVSPEQLDVIEQIIFTHVDLLTNSSSPKKKGKGKAGPSITPREQLKKALLLFVERRGAKFLSSFAGILQDTRLENLFSEKERRDLAVKLILKHLRNQRVEEQKHLPVVIGWVITQRVIHKEFTEYLLERFDQFPTDMHPQLRTFIETNLTELVKKGHNVEELKRSLDAKVEAGCAQKNRYIDLAIQLDNLGSADKNALYSLMKAYCEENKSAEVKKLFADRIKDLLKAVHANPSVRENVDPLLTFYKQVVDTEDVSAANLICDYLKLLPDTAIEKGCDKFFLLLQALNKKHGESYKEIQRSVQKGLDRLYHLRKLEQRDLTPMKQSLLELAKQRVPNELFFYAMSVLLPQLNENEIVDAFNGVEGGDCTRYPFFLDLKREFVAACARVKDFSNRCQLLSKGEKKLQIITEEEHYRAFLNPTISGSNSVTVARTLPMFKAFSAEIRQKLIALANPLQAKPTLGEGEVDLYCSILTELLRNSTKSIDPYIEQALRAVPPSVAKSERFFQFLVAYAQKAAQLPQDKERCFQFINDFIVNHQDIPKGAHAHVSELWDLINSQSTHLQSFTRFFFQRFLNFFIKQGDAPSLIRVLKFLQKDVKEKEYRLSPDSIRSYILRAVNNTPDRNNKEIRKEVQKLYHHFPDEPDEEEYFAERLTVLFQAGDPAFFQLANQTLDVESRTMTFKDGNQISDILCTQKQSERIIHLLRFLGKIPEKSREDISKAFEIVYQFFKKYDETFHISFATDEGLVDPLIRRIARAAIPEILRLTACAIKNTQKGDYLMPIVKMMEWITSIGLIKDIPELYALYDSINGKKSLVHISIWVSFCLIINRIKPSQSENYVGMVRSLIDNLLEIAPSSSSPQKKELLNRINILLSVIPRSDITRHSKLLFTVFEGICRAYQDCFFRDELEQFLEIFINWAIDNKELEKVTEIVTRKNVEIVELFTDDKKLVLRFHYFFLIALVSYQVAAYNLEARFTLLPVLVKMIRVQSIGYEKFQTFPGVTFDLKVVMLTLMIDQWTLLKGSFAMVESFEDSDSVNNSNDITHPKKLVLAGVNSKKSAEYLDLSKPDCELNLDEFFVGECPRLFQAGIDEAKSGSVDFLMYKNLFRLLTTKYLTDNLAHKQTFLRLIANQLDCFDPEQFSFFKIVDETISFKEGQSSELAEIYVSFAMKVWLFICTGDSMTINLVVDYFFVLMQKRLLPNNSMTTLKFSRDIMQTIHGRGKTIQAEIGRNPSSEQSFQEEIGVLTDVHFQVINTLSLCLTACQPKLSDEEYENSLKEQEEFHQTFQKLSKAPSAL